MSLALTEELYRIISPLVAACKGPLGYDFSRDKFEYPGLYLSFERGETSVLDGCVVPRIVRVGITTKKPLSKRLSEHYDYRGISMFKWHVACALLCKQNPHEILLATRQPYRADGFEDTLISFMRQQYAFVGVEIQQDGHRTRLEKRLIARLAQFPLGRPSDDWFGQYAVETFRKTKTWRGPQPNEAIRSSGLWNVFHIGDIPANEEDLDLFRQYVEQTIRDHWQ